MTQTQTTAVRKPKAERRYLGIKDGVVLHACTGDDGQEYVDRRFHLELVKKRVGVVLDFAFQFGQGAEMKAMEALAALHKKALKHEVKEVGVMPPHFALNPRQAERLRALWDRFDTGVKLELRDAANTPYPAKTTKTP